MGKTYLMTGGSSDLAISLLNRLMNSASNDDQFILQGYKNTSLIKFFQKTLAFEKQQQIHVYTVDLSDTEERNCFIHKITSNYSVSHFVHFPAAYVVNERFRNLNMDRLQYDINIQLNTAIEISKAIIPSMIEQKNGRIIFMLTSYILGAPPKNTASYTIVKSALQTLAKNLAVEYASKGITVNCIAPSMIETKFLSETSDLIVQLMSKNNPMKRNAQPEDISPAIAFLLSEDASYITGITLPITGGSVIV